MTDKTLIERAIAENLIPDNVHARLGFSVAVKQLASETAELRAKLVTAQTENGCLASSCKAASDTIESLQLRVARLVDALNIVDNASEECEGDDGELVFSVTADAIHAMRDALSHDSIDDSVDKALVRFEAELRRPIKDKE